MLQAGVLNTHAKPVVDEANDNDEASQQLESDPVTEEKILNVVCALGYDAALRNLRERPEAEGRPRHELLAAIVASDGLVHPARRVLQQLPRPSAVQQCPLNFVDESFCITSAQ